MEKEKYCVEKLEPWKELPVFSLFSTKGAGEETIEKPDGKRDIHSFDALRILVLKKFVFFILKDIFQIFCRIQGGPQRRLSRSRFCVGGFPGTPSDRGGHPKLQTERKRSL